MDIGILKQIPMCDVATACGFTMRRGFIPCPFHNEKTASCKIYTHSFYCFACHKGGDQIKFIQDYDSLPFKDAIKRLCDLFNIPYEGTAPKVNHKRNILKENYNAIEQCLTESYNQICQHLQNLTTIKKYWNAKMYTEWDYHFELCDEISNKLMELNDARYES